MTKTQSPTLEPLAAIGQLAIDLYLAECGLVGAERAGFRAAREARAQRDGVRERLNAKIEAALSAEKAS